MTIDTIETAETTPAKALVDQARANVKDHGRIVSIALDRGFLDAQEHSHEPEENVLNVRFLLTDFWGTKVRML